VVEARSGEGAVDIAPIPCHLDVAAFRRAAGLYPAGPDGSHAALRSFSPAFIQSCVLLMTLPDSASLQSDLEAIRSSVPQAAPYVDRAVSALASPVRPGLGGPTEAPDLSASDLAALIDHTELHPDATDADVDQVLTEALRHGFASVCIAPSQVPRAAEALADSGVAVCTVVGFPHGANRSSTKAHEAHLAVIDGARELDMVLNLGALTSGRFADVEADIRAVVEAGHDAADKVGAEVEVKVILETALLTDAEKAVACVLATRAGADFVKTSTGFADGGATIEDVALMRQVVGPDLGVKASGGVGSAADVRRMVAHGATRIGASGSVGIMESHSATPPA